MSENPKCTIYVGNLDERVSDRVLYDILIQAGRVVELHVPRDKETDRPKGYAFAEYETEEVADYAVRLFSGLVTLYSRTLKFAMSGQDKPSLNSSTEIPPVSNSCLKPQSQPAPYSSMRLSASIKFSEQLNYAEVQHGVVQKSNGYKPHYDHNNFDYSRRVFGRTLDSINRHRLGYNDSSNQSNHPYY